MTTLLLLVALPTLAAVPPPAETPPPDPALARLPMTHLLLKLARQEQAGRPLGVRPGRHAGVQVDDRGRINLEIVNRRGDDPVPPELVTAHGGEVDGVWRGQTSLWLAPGAAPALAGSLPPGFHLREASLPWENDQGPETVGSDTYLPAGGPGGQGIKVGIIDRNFLNLAAAQTQGVAPAVTEHNYTGEDVGDGWSRHGVGQLETVFDHAPNAEFHVFKIGNSTHLGMAVQDAITEGVHVLSATQSFYNEGWADDTGAGALAAKEAGDNGILYVTSSGNRGNDHWQGTFDGWGGGTWLDWDKGTGEDWQNMLGDVADSSTVRLYLQWDNSAGTPDYDLYLYGDGFSLLDISQNANDDFESISWQNLTGATVPDVFVAVMHIGGPQVELELFDNGSGSLLYTEPASSLTSPNNNTSPNCLVIGAVPFDDYVDGALYGYSSRGPTNSGARGIDLVGPTDTFSWVYGGAFTGTSCATPNVAGTAAALWSSVPQFSADGVRILLLHLALIYNDWGPAGPDPDYGYGGVRLPAHVADTEWVDPWADNPSNSPTLPWNSVSTALAVPGVARVITMGGQYPGTYLLNAPVTIVGLGDDSVVGGTTP